MTMQPKYLTVRNPVDSIAEATLLWHYRAAKEDDEDPELIAALARVLLYLGRRVDG